MILNRIRTRLSLRSPDGSIDMLHSMWKTLPLVVTLIWITLPATAQTNSNLCALLPDTDVSSVVGSPVKLAAAPVETHKAGSGTLRSQSCVYDGPGKVGNPTTVRIGIDEASSPALAAQVFKELATDYDKFMAGGTGKPVKDLGDEAMAWSTSVYMRKRNMIFNIVVGRQDLNEQKELDQCKQLAQKAAARIQ